MHFFKLFTAIISTLIWTSISFGYSKDIIVILHENDYFISKNELVTQTTIKTHNQIFTYNGYAEIKDKHFLSVNYKTQYTKQSKGFSLNFISTAHAAEIPQTTEIKVTLGSFKYYGYEAIKTESFSKSGKKSSFNGFFTIKKGMEGLYTGKKGSDIKKIKIFKNGDYKVLD